LRGLKAPLQPDVLYLIKQREKAQQKIAARAQRQAEPDVDQPLRGLKAPLQPDVLYLIIGSVVVALIGIGLLVWQLG
jgi:hypothetical protein